MHQPAEFFNIDVKGVYSFRTPKINECKFTKKKRIQVRRDKMLIFHEDRDLTYSSYIVFIPFINGKIRRDTITYLTLPKR